jgi:hypothetical protein
LFAALKQLAVGKLILFSLIAVAEAVDQQLHGLVSDLQEHVKRFALDLIDRSLVLNAFGEGAICSVPKKMRSF